MKKIKLILLAIVLLIINSCTQEHSIKLDESNSNSRIKMKEWRMIHGNTYIIIQVDSIEFLVLPDKAIHRLK